MAALLIQAWRFRCLLPVLFWSLTLNGQLSAPLHMGFAEVDVTPKEPIFMAGYAAPETQRGSGYPADGAGHGISEWHQDICDGLPG